MKHFITHADIGSIKIQTPAAGIFLDNGIGDGTYQVSIAENNEDKPDGFNGFAGYFEIYTDDCFLMESDCSNDPKEKLYQFPSGRYYAEHNNDGDIFIKRFKD